MRPGLSWLVSLALALSCSDAQTVELSAPLKPCGSALLLEPNFVCGNTAVPWALGSGAEDFGDGRAVSFAAADGAELICNLPALVCGDFDECLVSWNARHSRATGFAVEIAVARKVTGEFSPWMWIGEWNVSERPANLNLACEDSKIDVDTFKSSSTWRVLRARVRVRANDPAQMRFALDKLSIVPTLEKRSTEQDPRKARKYDAHKRLDVPFRSQRAEAAEISGRICSPTSLAMLLSYRGIDASTAEVARRAYDPFHDIYGNWNRAIQAANSFGVPGHLERIASWGRAEQCIADGQPLILSIAAKAGELHNAPYATTSGHLLVLCGFDAQGNALVNDPAAATLELGTLSYTRADLETVWMARGGTTYVLKPAPPKDR